MRCVSFRANAHEEFADFCVVKLLTFQDVAFVLGNAPRNGGHNVGAIGARKLEYATVAIHHLLTPLAWLDFKLGAGIKRER